MALTPEPTKSQSETARAAKRDAAVEVILDTTLDDPAWDWFWAELQR
jgi:hypothetical protein